MRTNVLIGKRDDLATQLNQLDNKVVSVRDQLDGDAQKIVQGIGILNDLVVVCKIDSIHRMQNLSNFKYSAHIVQRLF